MDRGWERGCFNFEMETFNRSNVKLVGISGDEKFDLYKNGIRTRSGAEHEVDMIIYALGLYSGTSAL